ncbi:unnamed protein product, partial [Staurois parvus]
MYVKCHFLTFLNFPPFRPPYVPTSQRNGTRKTDAGIGRRTLPGTLQGGHRGSAGQGKRRTDRCRVFPSVVQGYRLW